MRVSFSKLFFDHERKTKLETDASDAAISGVLEQQDPTNLKWHPTAFHSRSMVGPELNYAIGEKELLPIVECVYTWRHYVESLEQPLLILTDHKNLEPFRVSSILSRRQVRWSTILNGHKYELGYRPGSQNGKADALSRRSDLNAGGKASEAASQALLQPTKETMLKDKNEETFVAALITTPVGDLSSVEDEVREALPQDDDLNKLILWLGDKSNPKPKGNLHGYHVRDGLLFRNHQLVIPDFKPLQFVCFVKPTIVLSLDIEV